MMKRVLLYGGADNEVTAIRMANELGCYEAASDYLSKYPARKVSVEYHNVSATEIMCILKKVAFERSSL
jgi:hypothetical protein